MAAELLSIGLCLLPSWAIDNDVEAAVASDGIDGRSNVGVAVTIADVIGEANGAIPVGTWREGPASVLVIGDGTCLLYTSPSPRDYAASRMPSSA